MTLLSGEELAALDDAVSRALESGDDGGLDVLGYGEISTVVAWAGAAGPVAAKRLPPFDGEDDYEAYRRLVAVYVERLADVGVAPVETEVQGHRRVDGKVVGYVLQPRAPAETLVTERLGRCGEAEAVDLVEAIVEVAARATSSDLGLDGQVSNWAEEGGELRYLDVSTPLIRDAEGEDLLDTDLFIGSLPWALRGLVRWRFLHVILDKFFDPRGVVVDLLGNLIKEGHRGLLPPLLSRINAAPFARPSISMREVDGYYRSDAYLWELLQRLRRADRLWQRHVRRWTYQFLLPGKIERNV